MTDAVVYWRLPRKTIGVLANNRERVENAPLYHKILPYVGCKVVYQMRALRQVLETYPGRP